MKERNLKKHIKSFIYASSALVLVVSVVLIGQINKKGKEDSKEQHYVTNTVVEEVVPVVGDEETVGRPYTDQMVKVARNFYDYKGEATSQLSSIVYYENTYIQNSGIDYSGIATFDVVAIMDGTVTKVTEDKMLGKIIEVRHNNDLISVYQSLSDVTVKKDDKVTKGQILGKSGTSAISSELKDHLHFEVSYKGEMLNPETIYDKTTNQLEG